MNTLMNKASFPLSEKNALADSLVFIRKNLTEVKAGSKLTARAMTACEEMLLLFVDNAPEDAVLQVRFVKTLSEYYIDIRCRGEQFDPYDSGIEDASDLKALGRDDAGRAIRSILLKSYADKLKYSNSNGINRAQITAGKAEQSMLMKTVIALVLGIVLGLILKFLLPHAVSEGVNYYFLVPVRTMFMNALKLIIGPVIFFSIVSCLSSFKDLSELGRIGAKVMGSYILTTIIAVCLAVGLSVLLHPGQPGFALGEQLEAHPEYAQEVDTSLWSTIINIVPANFVKPFLESDTMQIMFIAVLCGIAVGMVKDYSETLKKIFDAGNTLAMTITSLITRFIPLAVFCSVAHIVDTAGSRSAREILGFIGTHFLTVICMLAVYGLIILIIGRLNPFRFYAKFKEGMLTGLALASSTAAMPTNLRICTEKLGISPMVCNFSIPLGATVNMDGTCITLTIAGLFLARAYDVEITAATLLSVMVTSILLSLGCPGVPGAGLICLGIVLQLMNVPVEAIGLIIGIYPFIDIVNTMSKITGDVAVSAVVARSEGLLDTNVYNSRQ